jgi:hypothetical protein
MGRGVTIALLGAALALPATAAGTGKQDSFRAAIRDCNDDGVLQGTYTRRTLRLALEHMSPELHEYSDCADVFLRALSRRPTITIVRAPRRCVSKWLVVRVRVRVLAPPQTLVYVDHRRVKSTTRLDFEVRRDVRHLAPGRHRLHVTAVDEGGHDTIKRRSFTKCHRSRGL